MKIPTVSELISAIIATNVHEYLTAYAREDGTEVHVWHHRSARTGHVWYAIVVARGGRGLTKKQVAYQPGAAAKKARALVTRVVNGAFPIDAPRGSVVS